MTRGGSRELPEARPLVVFQVRKFSLSACLIRDEERERKMSKWKLRSKRTDYPLGKWS